MAESLQWALWVQVCLLYMEVPVPRLGQPMGATSWATAKNGEKSTRWFGGLETSPFSLRGFTPSTKELDCPWD